MINCLLEGNIWMEKKEKEFKKQQLNLKIQEKLNPLCNPHKIRNNQTLIETCWAKSKPNLTPTKNSLKIWTSSTTKNSTSSKSTFKKSPPIQIYTNRILHSQVQSDPSAPLSSNHHNYNLQTIMKIQTQLPITSGTISITNKIPPQTIKYNFHTYLTPKIKPTLKLFTPSINKKHLLHLNLIKCITLSSQTSGKKYSNSM